MMERRAFLGALAAPRRAALCQRAAGEGSADRVPRFGRPPANRAIRGPFLQGLDDHGYVEGRNVLIEYRYAEGNIERLPALAAELVALKVDIIVASAGTLGALGAQKATSTLPIVFIGVGDPVTNWGSSPALRGWAAMSRAWPLSLRS